MGRISTLNRQDQSDPLGRSNEVTGLPLGEDGSAAHALDININTLGSVSKRWSIDSGDADILYLGYWRIGESDNVAGAVCAIKRVDTSADGILDWADGDQIFNNVWNDREALTYEN